MQGKRLEDLCKALELEVFCGHSLLDLKFFGAYCGDLLSDVMANSKKGDVWITIQTHQNILAVSVLKEHAAIIISGGKRPDPDTINKARGEKIPILGSKRYSFEVCGMVYEFLKG